jgi:hypothetical protein
MLKNIPLLLFTLLLHTAYSQSNLTIFNNNGQPFYVILNGIRQNTVAQTNVSVTGIKDGSYSVKLIFADGKTSDIDKNFFIDAPSDITTRVIFKKGKGKLQLIGIVPTKGSLQDPAAVAYRPTDVSVYTDASTQGQGTVTNQQGGSATIGTNTTGIPTGGTVTTTTQQQGGNVVIGTSTTGIPTGGTVTTTTQQQGGNVVIGTSTTGIPIGGTVTTTTQQQSGNGSIGISTTGIPTGGTVTTTTTQQGGNATIGTNTTGIPTGGNVNVGMNGTIGVNVNAGITGTTVGGTTSTSSTNSTSTTTTSNTTMNTGTYGGTVSGTTGPGTTGVNTSTTTNSGTYGGTTGVNTTGTVTCTRPYGDMTAYLKDLKSIKFESDRVETIQKDMASYCVSAKQASDIISTLTFESDRFDIAKYLYNRMIDKQNATTLLPLFTFESTKNNFRDYIR